MNKSKTILFESLGEFSFGGAIIQIRQSIKYIIKYVFRKNKQINLLCIRDDDTSWYLINKERISDYSLYTSRPVYKYDLDNSSEIKLVNPSDIDNVVIGVFLEEGTQLVESVCIEGAFITDSDSVAFSQILDRDVLSSLNRPSYWIDISIPFPKKIKKASSVCCSIKNLKIVPILYKAKIKSSFFSLRSDKMLDKNKPSLILVMSNDGITSQDLDRKSENGDYLYPNYQRLKSNSISYDKAIASATVTGSNAACLLTGLGLSRHKIYDYDRYHTDSNINKYSSNIVTLPELLKKNGYNTYAQTVLSKWRPHYGYSRGFDQYHHVCSGAIHQYPFLLKSIDLISNAKKTNSFVLLHLPGGHPPFVPFIDAEDKCDPQYALYYSNLKTVDESIQAILGYLKESDLFDDSLIYLLSDHGRSIRPYSGRKGYQFNESRLHVPLMLKLPTQYQKAILHKKYSQYVSANTFVYQSLHDILGVKLPDYYNDMNKRDYDGVSWMCESIDYRTLDNIGIVGYDECFKWIVKCHFDKDLLCIGQPYDISAYKLGQSSIASDDKCDLSLIGDRVDKVKDSVMKYLNAAKNTSIDIDPYTQGEDTFIY